MKQHHRAKETGYPGARAGSAAETRKVEITESGANNLKPSWKISRESDLEFVPERIHPPILHLKANKDIDLEILKYSLKTNLKVKCVRSMLKFLILEGVPIFSTIQCAAILLFAQEKS